MTLIKLGRLRAIYISRACAKAIYVTHKTQWREILRLRQHQRRKDARLFFFFFFLNSIYTLVSLPVALRGVVGSFVFLYLGLLLLWADGRL